MKQNYFSSCRCSARQNLNHFSITDTFYRLGQSLRKSSSRSLWMSKFRYSKRSTPESSSMDISLSNGILVFSEASLSCLYKYTSSVSKCLAYIKHCLISSVGFLRLLFINYFRLSEVASITAFTRLYSIFFKWAKPISMARRIASWYDTLKALLASHICKIIMT